MHRLALQLLLLLIICQSSVAADRLSAAEHQNYGQARFFRSSLVDPWHRLWRHHYRPLLKPAVDLDPRLLVPTRFGNILGTYVNPVYQATSPSNESARRQQRSKLSPLWPRVFAGIPYAEPPVRELRFRYPREWTRRWDEVYGRGRDTLNATRFGPQCVQFLSPSFTNVGEDCLHINVFVPPYERAKAFQRTGKRFPVLFWNFGGAFSFGSSGAGEVNGPNTYNGAYVVANKDVIVVTYNYRVGPFGFLMTGDLTGNYGLADSVAALQWTYENIADFGGDPERILSYGMSSGAFIANALALNPHAAPIYRTIVMSSPMSLFPREHQDARKMGRALMERIGCDAEDTGCLRKRPALGILLSGLATYFRFSSQLGHSQLTDPLKWMPTKDPIYFPGRHMDLVRSPFPALRERIQKMHFMVGTTQDEIGLFLGLSELVGRFRGGTFFFLRGKHTSWFQYLLRYVWERTVNGTTANPKMVGTNLFASPLPTNDTTWKKYPSQIEQSYANTIRELFLDDTAAVEIILQRYPPKKSVEENLDSLVALMSAYIFICPARQFVRDLEALNGTVYQYETTQPPLWLLPVYGKEGYLKRDDVVHAGDLLYPWHYYPNVPAGEEGISRLFIDYFAAFAAQDPNYHPQPPLYAATPPEPSPLQFQNEVGDTFPRTLPQWPRYTSTSQEYLDLGTPRNQATPRSGFHQVECDFWDTLRSSRPDSPKTTYPF